MNLKITPRATFLRGALVGLATVGLAAGSAQAQTVYGLATNTALVTSLVAFNATTPGTFTATVPITGVTIGQKLVGMDVRPNTGELFSLGYNPTGTVVQMYTINRTTGLATTVGPTLTLDLGPATAINRIGFDFNPTVDRIRLVSGNGANFRLNPNNGALAFTDGMLAYAAGDANAGQTPGVGSAAYTNSYIGTTATTLYDLDETASRLVTQNPPNDGILNTVGPLGVATDGATQVSDLDIYFDPTTGTNVAYMTTAIATSLTSVTSTLYTVNLTTGAATAVGALGSGEFVAISDIAVAIDRPATLPAITGNLAYALAGGNLLTFDTATPTAIRTSVGITGVDAAQTLVGMDIRPATNTLYALGYNATAQMYQLYSLNSVTGVATAVNADPIELALGTGKISFDFNPTVDRIRVMSSNRANFRISPIDGMVAVIDGTLTYAAGDANAAATPNIGAAAYTNSVAGTTATATTLYDYDLSLNIITRQAPPNDGTLNTVGASGITANATTPNIDMDIYSSAAGTNTAYLVANTGISANTSLYTVDLTTGATTLVGAIGNGIAARDITIGGSTGVTTPVRAAKVATGFTLYPNPVEGQATLRFTLPRAGQAELTVSDALGRTVDQITSGMLSGGSHELRWESSALKSGFYFMRLTLDGQSAGTQRIIVK